MRQIVCDKCKKELKIQSHKISFDERELDLCGECFYHVKEWLDKPEKKPGFFKGMLK